MHLRARGRPGEEVTDHHRAVRRDKNVIEHQRFAAGAREAEHLPVVDDLDVGERHEEVRDAAQVAHLAEEGAEDRPLRVVASAGKGVVAGQAPAARNRPGGSPRRQRRSGDRFGIGAPNVDLSLFGILGDDPLMLGQNRIYPGRGRAAKGQLLGDPRKEAEAALHPAEAPGLQDTQYARRTVFGDRRVGDASRRGRRCRALGEARDQRPRAFQHYPLAVGQRAVVARERGVVSHRTAMRPSRRRSAPPQDDVCL
jgi:hypothetical protein